MAWRPPVWKKLRLWAAVSRRCARQTSDPLHDQAAGRVDDERAVTFVRTNETRSRGVSDPIGAGLRAKLGPAEPGSLTPRLPRTPSSPAASGSSRGTDRRAVLLGQPADYQRHAAVRPTHAPLLGHGRIRPSRSLTGE